MAASESELEEILDRVRRGNLSPAEAKEMISSYADLGFARIDIDRARRKGFSEVVYAENKSTEQVEEILNRLRATENRLLATRVSASMAERLLEKWDDLRYNPTARTISWTRGGEPRWRLRGYVAVVSGGTSDMPVAEEAAETVEALGAQSKRIYDVGVAGIHRLFAHIDTIAKATAAVVVAGMEGALSSVVAGLVPCPVVAVPTSVGYGANLGGVAALLTMINSCAPGISVVNIDNGFGAGYFAASLCRQVTLAHGMDGDDVS